MGRGSAPNECKHIAKRRRALGMTQHTLAAASGVLFSRLKYAETGRLILSADEIEKLRAALGRRARRLMDAVFVA
jgi:transcriptional regulator with XRE-family HTH domain